MVTKRYVVTIIETLGARAHRRPLQASEIAAYTALFETGRELDGSAYGVELVIRGMLQSPYFLYHVELGEPGASGATRLTQYELASRLSFFLWNTMPDDELLWLELDAIG